MAVPGSVVGVGKLITPGGAVGPKGDAGTAANVPLADITQNGLLRQTSGNTTDFTDGTNNYQPLAPVIWSARLRSFNAVGNPNFEVDQRNAGNDSTNPATGTYLLDRWMYLKSGTMTVNSSRIGGGGIVIPGTSYAISASSRSLKLTGQETTLAAGDYCGVMQTLEGCNWRELSNDVTSLSLLVVSDVANLKFSVSIRPPDGTQSLVKLCTVPSAGVWTLITLPNLPKPTSGNFSILPGVSGYTLGIFLACGSTWIAPAADTWQSGNFFGAPGMDNWCSKPVNTNFYCAFVQHEPGPLCTTLMDKPFTQNYDECLRYYQKTYDYAVKPGSVSTTGRLAMTIQAGFHPYGPVPFKKQMAKAPTIVGYSPPTGAINSVRDENAGADKAISSPFSPGESGFGGFTLTAANSGATWYDFHYTADTGW